MKNLELFITKAWQQQSAWLTALAPLAWLYGRVSDAKKRQYQSGKKPSYKASVPVLVIGNITVGGSGKTPLIIALVRYLQAKQIKVGVISRGYGGQSQKTPSLVRLDSTPDLVGDEPCLIVQNTVHQGAGVPMAVGANRQAAIELLQQHYPQIELILSDDGLQHYALARDDEWIVVDAVRGFGNGKLLPQGFLREPIERLNGATVIYHDSEVGHYPSDALTMYLSASQLEPLLGSASDNPPTTDTPVYAMSGIGYPQRFFGTLQTLGYQCLTHSFGDHHQFVLTDLLPFADRPIIVTSKDAVKLRQLAQQSPHQIFSQIWVLPVVAVLSDAVYRQLDEFIADFVKKQA